MSLLDQRIGHARRRLTNNVFMQQLSIGILLAAGLWTLTILVVRLFALNVPLAHGAWIAALLAALIALIGTGRLRPSALGAAVALDAAAGLKERLSTALVMRSIPDPFAQAAVGDAEKSAGRVHVPAHIRYQPPTLWPWSGAAILTALILFLFMPTVDVLRRAQAAEPSVDRAAVEAEHAVIKTELEDRLNKIKELAQDNPALKDIAADIKPFDMPDTPGMTQEDLRRAAVKRMDEVTEKLQQELANTETNSSKDAKRLLNKLEPQGGDKAAAKLSQALAAGDFEGAKQAMQKLQLEIEEAAKSTDSPEARQKLEEMQEQLNRLADQVSKLSDTIQLQKELENKGGLTEEQAKQLLDKLSQMDPKQLEKELQKVLGDKGMSQQQMQQMVKKIQQNQQAKKACQNLAKSLSKASKGCQQCNSPGGASAGSSSAANALSNAASQLSELEMSEQLQNELQAQISDLENLREGVCQGKCQGNGLGKRPSDKIGNQGPNEGLGLGARIGKEKTAYKGDPTKAPTRFQGGSIVGQMLIDGPQVRGEASREALEAVASDVREAQDAIEREEVPRQYQKVLREYFERLAGLVREKQQKDAPPPKSDEKQD